MENVIETGTVRVWRGIDRLERVALLTTKGCGSNAMPFGPVGTSWCASYIGLPLLLPDVLHGGKRC